MQNCARVRCKHFQFNCCRHLIRHLLLWAGFESKPLQRMTQRIISTYRVNWSIADINQFIWIFLWGTSGNLCVVIVAGGAINHNICQQRMLYTFRLYCSGIWIRKTVEMQHSSKHQFDRQRIFTSFMLSNKKCCFYNMKCRK